MSKKHKGQNSQQQTQLQERLAKQEQELSQLREQLESRGRELEARQSDLAPLEQRLAERELELDQKSDQLDGRERNVAQRELLAEPGLAERNRAALEDLERRETLCREREGNLSERERAVRDQEQALTNREGGLLEQERRLTEREMNATAGFLEQNRAALASLERHRGELGREIESLNTQIAERRQAHLELLNSQEVRAEEARNALDAELTRTRQQRLLSLEEQIRVEGEDRRRELGETLRREREECLRLLGDALSDGEAELTRQRGELQTLRQELEEERVRLRQQAVEIEQHRVRVEVAEVVCREERSSLRETIEDRVREAVEEAQRNCEQRDRRIEEIREERDRFWKRLQDLEELRSQLGEDPEQLRARLRGLAADNERLQKERGAWLADRVNQEQMQTLRRERAQWHTDRETLTRELLDLRAKRDTWAMGVAERENAHRLREVAERHVETMDAQVRKLQGDVNRLRALYEKPQELAKRRAPILKPHIARAQLGAEAANERAWLEQIRDGCARSGFVFPPRLVTAFHTALKTAEWSPLAVLAGVSGTGKSKLPELYARFGGLNYLLLSVQPNWDSPHSLFGFFNAVDNEFNATPLVRCLEQCQREPGNENAHGLNDQLLLVLLDEMNLAHIELYFSELLSKLEDRRGKVKGTPLEIDLGGGEIHPIDLGRNVLWAGTMNEDETTKTLSDKVLDRGNVLVFPRPRELRRRERSALADASPLLPRGVWDGWVRSRSTFSDGDVAPYKQFLESMNSCLERAGRALGHRVWQSAEHYMANHPDVIAAQAAGDAEQLKQAMLLAFEDQLVQKVMPKLRGIETSGVARQECLGPIRAQLEESGIRLLQDFDIACAAGYGGFVWRSAHYLEATP